MDFSGKRGRKATSEPIKDVIAKGIISFTRIVATVMEKRIPGGLPKKNCLTIALGRM